MKSTEAAKKLLEGSRLFGGFSTEVINAMAPLLTPCHFKKDNLVFLKGDVSDCLYIINHGEVEVSVTSQDGKIIVLGLLTTGDVVGEVGFFDKQSRTANVTAKTDLSLYRLSNDDFEKIKNMFGSKEFIALTSYICFLFRRVTNNLEETVFLDASVRVAKKLGELCRRNDGPADSGFKITISQEELGRMTGLSREATNKSLSRLEEDGLIERQYRKIYIPDIPKFLRTLSEN